MTKESSVAPKERVNIRYRPAVGDAREEVELPLKLVMLGDYTMRPNDTPVEDRAFVEINKDNFNDVLKSHDLSLDLAVPNRLVEADDPGALSVSLKFQHLNDFTPDSIVQQTPSLKKLLDLREALVALKGPLGNVPAFRRAIQGVLGNEEARDKLLSELTAALSEAKA